MLESIVRASVRQRGLVLGVWLASFLLAFATKSRLAIDAIPDVTNTQVNVITSAPGLSAAEVEQYLTTPVEMAMSGLPRLTQVRSTSRPAVSLVTLVFEDGMDLWFARQLVAERLKEAETLIPPRYGAPAMAPVSTALGEIYQFYLSSPKRSPAELRTLMDWDVSLALRSVPGVVEVNVMGGAAKEFQVVANPHRLRKHHITLPMLAEALRRNNLNVGSGYIEKDMEAYTIRGEAQFKNLDDIGMVVVTTHEDGTPVLVRQVAHLVEGSALAFGSVTKHGVGEIVSGTVMMLIGQNSQQVAKLVKAKVQDLQKQLPDDVTIHSYYDRTEFIDRMLHTVSVNLAEGAALVVVILLITLGSLRAALIASLAIPFSMGLCIMAMELAGISGNLMSLGALDFGLLTDGAVVMLEVALASFASRHMQPGEDLAGRIADSMAKGARAVLFSLTIILLVYLPLTTLEGSEGRMFRPMAVTIAFALAAALLYSLTAVPALASVFLRAGAHKEDWLDRLGRRYCALLVRALARPRPWLVGATLGVVASLALATQLGAEFLPRLEEGELLLDVRRPPSIGLSAALALGIEAEEVVARFPEVVSVVTKTGRAEVATNPSGFDSADVLIKLRPREEWRTASTLEGLGSAIKAAIEAAVPATSVGVSQPIEDTINNLLVGSRADVAIKLYGDDLAELRKSADALAQRLQNVPGLGDMRVQEVLGLPLLEISPDRARLARYGMDAQDILGVVEASRLGQQVGLVFEGAKRFDLRLFLPPTEQTPAAFGDLMVSSATGQLLPLAAVADVRETEGPAVIYREDLRRRVMVEINVRGRDLVSFVGDAQAAVRDVALPVGVKVAWGGQFENFNRAKARLSLVVPVALAVIFVMLYFMFGEASYAAVVFVTVPLALLGGIAALALRQLPFSIPAAIGFVAVSGVSVLNGVVMASHVREATGADAGGAVVQGAASSLRAIVTTSLVAAIGFLPLAVSTHAGAEVQRPLASVVIGGILSSSLLGLVVLPILLRWVRREAPRGG